MSPDLFKDQIVDQLSQLENAELVRRLPEEDLAYFFKHALTQESAYESLLLKTRHNIHRLVADAYEQLYPAQLDENAALLAQHYHAAGDDAKTFAYAVRAGDAEARVFAYTEACAHYTQALDALSRLRDTAENRKLRADTLLKQVSVSLRAVGPPETLRRLAVAETLARPYAVREGATRQDRLRLARVQYWRGQTLIHQNEMRSAIQQLQQVLQVARAENDPPLLAMPASVIGRTLVAQGQFAQALPMLTDAIAALEKIHDDHEWVLAVGFRGVAMTMLGDYAGGVAEGERALAHATESNTLTGIALAHGTLGMVRFFGNAPARGGADAREMIQASTQSGDRLYAYTAYGFLAWSDIRADDCAAAEKDFAQADAIAQEIGGQLLFADWFAAARAEQALHCGQVERAMELAAETIEQAQRSSSVFAEGFGERIQGQALASLGDQRLQEAENHLANSLARFEQSGARLEAARTRVAWSEVMRRHGDTLAAREQLDRAAAQFRASGLITEQEQAQQLIASLP